MATSASENIRSSCDKFNEWIEKASLEQKDYQVHGVRRMLELEMTEEPLYGCRGGLLTDEMGLGKTIQMLGLIVSNQVKRTLIVMPRALLDQWETAIIKYLGHHPLVFHGGRKTEKDFKTSPVVITTYGMITYRKSDKEEEQHASPLASIRWNRIIYDEAHHLRNKGTATFAGASKLQSSIKWFVTGTPIQNAIGDLYSLLRIFGISPDIYRNEDGLINIMKHFNIGRTKKQVGINLKDVMRHRIVVDWETDEEHNVAADIHSLLSFSKVTVKNVNKMISFLANHPLPALLRMRQMCIDGTMLKAAAEKMVDNGILDKDDIQSGGLEKRSKLNAVMKTIRERKDNGNSKIIFTHFHHEIDYIEKKLREMGLSVGVVDGRVSQCVRDDILTSTYDVLILQIKASCEGLNLQHYNEVYFTSPHWNPAVVDQAIARAHRIGQTKKVEVFEYEMAGFGDGSLSIDGYCFQIQSLKRKIMKIFEDS